MSAADDIFGGARPSAKRRARPGEAARRRTWVEAVGRLCKNGDFAVFMYETLDDFCYFDRDERPVDDFGQGIRNAGSRIANRMMESPEAVDFIVGLTRKHHSAYHKRLVEERERGDNEQREGDRP